MPPFIPRKRRASTSPLEPPPKSAKAPTKAPANVKNTTIENSYVKNIEAGVDDDADSGSLSDVPSDQFEDVAGLTTTAAPGESDDVDSEDHDDWEDAIGAPIAPANLATEQTTGDLELTLDRHSRIPSTADFYGGSKGPSKIERHIRVQTHCMHVQLLLFHNVVRNAWVCDKEVQRVLVGQLPKNIVREVERWKLASGLNEEEPPIKMAKSSRRSKGSRKDGSDRNQRDWGHNSERLERGVPDLSRGDPLVSLLKVLRAYWRKRFVITAPGLRKVGYKDPAALQERVLSFQNESHNSESHGERVESLKQFRNLAKSCHGSRDVGAQLFTALLRGLGIETRMIANLQPIGFGWTKAETASTSSEETGVDAEDEGDTRAPNAAERTRQDKTKKGVPQPRPKAASAKRSSRKNVSKPMEISDSDELASLDELSSDESVVDVTTKTSTQPSKKYDQDLLFPIYWSEAISPISSDVITVDPLVMSDKNAIAITQDQLAAFEPRGGKAEETKQVIAYVVAYSQDGTTKDVTTRYLKKHMWPGKTKGIRLPVEKVPVYSKSGKVKRYEEYDWFKDTLRHYTRSSMMRTAVDDLEEQKDLKVVQPQRKVVKEDTDTLQSLKNSEELVLERFLRREEALKPGSRHVRTFKSGKGDKAKEEKVFLRKDVVRCLSAESWHKEGRKVKAGEYPLKHVPVRAVTLVRKREVEEAERETGEKMKQGLYSRSQTEWIIPPPIKNGRIPKNAFGNMDCFVPSMVPKGAVHIPLPATVRICKKLDIDYAEAVTGFEFGNKRAVPIIEGVIVAAENEHAVIDAWETDQAAKKKKEESKQEKLILSTWRKFLMGLRIAERVQAEYGGENDDDVEENALARRNHTWDNDPPPETAVVDDTGEGGGFLLEGEDSPVNTPGEMIVDHGESDGAESIKECERGAYPRTPNSLPASSELKSKPEQQEGPESGVSSSFSDLSSIDGDSDMKIEESPPILKQTSTKRKAKAIDLDEERPARHMPGRRAKKKA